MNIYFSEMKDVSLALKSRLCSLMIQQKYIRIEVFRKLLNPEGYRHIGSYKGTVYT